MIRQLLQHQKHLRRQRPRQKNNLIIFKVLFFGVFLGLLPNFVLAMSSSNYQVLQYDMPAFGDSASSEHYKLNMASGPILGVGSSASYGLDIGFPSETGGTISLSLDANSVDLGKLNPGTPVTGTTVATVATDSLAGYSLSIEKNQLLTKTTNATTIADFSGTIATPVAWTGVGFGFTVSSGTSVEAKWGSGDNYAAIPTQTATTAHTVTQTLNAPNNTTFRYKLDTNANQENGVYQTLVSISATPLP